MDIISLGLYITYSLIGFGVLMTLGFGIKKIFDSTNNLKKMGYTLGGLVLIIVLSYSLASDEILNSYEAYDITSSTSKRVGIGLYTFYLLSASAILAIIYSELSKIFSK